MRRRPTSTTIGGDKPPRRSRSIIENIRADRRLPALDPNDGSSNVNSANRRLAQRLKDVLGMPRPVDVDEFPALELDDEREGD